ncbi:MAG TPA: hypothetical protein VFG86_04530, partial [Chloroflexota bacterium]|nr:hypothetical protein [Chloroflexota bacterium]
MNGHAARREPDPHAVAGVLEQKIAGSAGDRRDIGELGQGAIAPPEQPLVVDAQPETVALVVGQRQDAPETNRGRN